MVSIENFYLTLGREKSPGRYIVNISEVCPVSFLSVGVGRDAYLYFVDDIGGPDDLSI